MVWPSLTLSCALVFLWISGMKHTILRQGHPKALKEKSTGENNSHMYEVLGITILLRAVRPAG